MKPFIPAMILSLQGFHEKEQKIKMQFNNNSTYSFALRTKELPLLFSKHDGTIRQIRWLVSRVNEEVMKYTFVEKKKITPKHNFQFSPLLSPELTKVKQPPQDPSNCITS